VKEHVHQQTPDDHQSGNPGARHFRFLVGPSGGTTANAQPRRCICPTL
jgi:hypothetical protein